MLNWSRYPRQHPGQLLREELAGDAVIEPFLGIYDLFSAGIAGRFSPNLFLSGFGFSASHYGLPDVGYIAWSDMVAAAWRVRQILPAHKLLVDIDDGYVDVHVAQHVIRQLDAMGVAMVMLEDQARPRRCGHVDGKQILPLPAYIDKLTSVLADRENLCVLARTDASGEEIFRRVEAISKTDAEVLLVDGIDSVETLLRVRASTHKPLLFNQINGGKSPALSLAELRALGVRVVQYSTPLLFAAQQAMEQALVTLLEKDGALPDYPSGANVGVKECLAVLNANVERARGARSAVPVSPPAASLAENL
jgi:2-methylisocitrate lyase-like PEP mutase family enzyme